MLTSLQTLSLVVMLALALSVSASEGIDIIGGEAVTAEQRPWVVKIHFKGKGHCTGSLIHKQWVLTAAHCFQKATAPYTNFTLGAGGDGKLVNLERLPNIKQVFLHPNYRGTESTPQDLALLRLEAPVKVAKNLAPIPLKNLSNVRLADDAVASITAWGLVSSRGETPTELRSISLPVKRATDLGDERPEYFVKYPHYLKPGVLVMIKPGVTTCRGDSGAGWTMTIDGAPFLIGVHSAGDFCQSIAIGAEVSQSILWIRTRMFLSGL